jgi:hypothetical protein
VGPARPGRLFAYLVGGAGRDRGGYLLSWRGVARLAEAPPDPEVSEARAVAFLRAAVAVTILMLVPSPLSRTGEWFPDVVEGILNAGAVYNSNFERLEAGNPSWSWSTCGCCCRRCWSDCCRWLSCTGRGCPRS